jgi:chorismate mutase/prephenate dehydratase
MSPEEAQRLNELRERIDRLDEQLVTLLNDRARVSLEVGAVKGPEAAVFVPSRETELLARLRSLNSGPLRPEDINAIYREIISASRRLQRPLRIGYFGPAATFTHQAALQRFGEANEFIPHATISDVLAEIERGNLDYGVIPVENSTGGSVPETLDVIGESELKISAEITLPIAQTLMANCALDEITTIYSHFQSIAQTRRWIAANLPGRRIVESLSNGSAAETASQEAFAAAIGPRLAADVYGLRVLAENIQDLSNNFTRFFVLGSEIQDRPTGHDKTLLLFSIRDHVGALKDIVTVFADAAINMSAIQSRPSRRKPWDYLFFVEIQGHIAEPHVRDAVQRAEEHCVTLRVLGAWPDERLG